MKVILVHTPKVNTAPSAPMLGRCCRPLARCARRKVTASRTVSSELENGLRRKVKVRGELAKSKREVDDPEILQMDRSVQQEGQRAFQRELLVVTHRL